ncbi:MULTISPECIES: hypothetical protein [Streptomyces]|uniref:Uncharacterized protein n=2 Tax=Streptomyces TaxID=1883 RepID=A0ABV9IXX2_9ACTN
MNDRKPSKTEFMATLRQQWEAQPTEQYEFIGLTGMNYNDWLEHRHGWPVGNDGNCLVHSEMDELPAEECAVCAALLNHYEREHGTDDEPEKLKLEILRLERRLAAYESAVKRMSAFPENKAQINRDLEANLSMANEQHDRELTKLLVTRNVV